VEDGVNGRLVAPGDPREAAAVIDETLGSPSLLAALAAGARATSLEYTYERRAERIEDALCIST
jgi:glycosyltransferase involved in cell wall biosynthesis